MGGMHTLTLTLTRVTIAFRFFSPATEFVLKGKQIVASSASLTKLYKKKEKKHQTETITGEKKTG